ncbi:MAG: rod shape-determining protein MreC [Terriglobales bacterium]
MDRYLHRNRNRTILSVLVLAQLVLIGFQVRQPQAGGVTLVRLWSGDLVLPLEQAADHVAGGIAGLYHNYIGLAGVRRQNLELQQQVGELQLRNQQLQQQTRELPQLAALLGFQRAFRLKTLAAEVVAGGAEAEAQAVYVNRGRADGLERNMAVITPQGVVGKLSQVDGHTAQVLLVTDADAGLGAVVTATGVHGIVRGLGAGQAQLQNVLTDEPLAAGMAVVTSGEDQVYPAGLKIGTVSAVLPGTDGVFKSARLRLAADFGRLAQVLIITAAVPAPPASPQTGLTAADVRQSRLPGLAQPAAGIVSDTPAALTVPTPPGTPPLEGDALGAATKSSPPAPAKKTTKPVVHPR